MRALRSPAAVMAALCLLFAVTSPAAAYTIMDSNYPASPGGCTNRFDSVAGRYLYCFRWPMTPSGYSTHVKVYLDPSLGQNLAQMDLRPAAVSAMGRWNAIPASSPFLDTQHVNGLQDSTSYHYVLGGGYIYGGGTEIVKGPLDYNVLGETEPGTTRWHR